MTEPGEQPMEPKLDDTLDAKVSDAPNPRVCGVAKASFWLGLGGLAFQLLLFCGTRSPEAIAVVIVLTTGPALITILTGLVALISIASSKGQLTGILRTAMGITCGVIVLLAPWVVLFITGWARGVHNPPESSRAAITLTVGILGIVVCSPLAVVALVICGKERKAIVEGRMTPNPMATIGWVLGVIGTVLLVAVLLLVAVGVVMHLMDRHTT